MSRKNLDFLSTALIAHRGLHGGKIVENSLSAFGAAVHNGYTIELDVHILADGNVVVFHDDNLKRICGADVNIRDLTVRKIRKYHLGDTNERIPLLKDALSLINGAVPIIIELKYDAPVGKLEKALIDILKDYPGEFALKSFHPLIVRKLRHTFRTRPIGQLYSRSIFEDLPRFKRVFCYFIISVSMMKSDFISVDKRDLEVPIVSILREFAKPILAWTIKSANDRLYSMKYADNCICEKIL